MTATEVRERGIIFQGREVRAILDGSKTQTRRTRGLEDANRKGLQYAPSGFSLSTVSTFDVTMASFRNFDESVWLECRCPYGKPGDRLWVRETFCDNGGGDVEYRADSFSVAGSWSPSIHMPRWASRILLEITDVRVQRVQEIDRDDAIAEGVPQTDGEARLAGIWDGPGHEWDNRTSSENFSVIWDEINAKRGYGWDANPWVWAITFRRLAA